MKGLLIKDFKLIFYNIRMIITLVVISFFLLFSSNTADRYDFVISYLTVVSFMFVLSSVSYDDFDHGLSFLMTLPVSRKTYVREKYCFGLLCGIAGWIFAILLCFLFTLTRNTTMVDILNADFMSTSVSVYILLTFILSVTLPIQLKFGGDNGKIFIILIIGALFVIGFAVNKIAAGFNVNLTEWLNRLLTLNTVSFMLILCAAALAALFVSYMISNKIMRNKQL